MIGASSFFTVIAGMSFLSEEFRAIVVGLLAGDRGGQLTALAFKAQSVGHDLVRSAAEYRANNAPMLAFGVVAVVLAFLMFKT
jgi:hypothetical protein